MKVKPSTTYIPNCRECEASLDEGYIRKTVGDHYEYTCLKCDRDSIHDRIVTMIGEIGFSKFKFPDSKGTEYREGFKDGLIRATRIWEGLE